MRTFLDEKLSDNFFFGIEISQFGEFFMFATSKKSGEKEHRERRRRRRDFLKVGRRAQRAVRTNRTIFVLKK